MSTPECRQCGEVVAQTGAKYAINALGAHWHKDCFNCVECNQRLFSFAKFFNRGGFPVCKKCNDVKNPDCGACSKKISGTYVEAQGKQWHPACFKCSGCGKQFGDGEGFFEDDNMLWHLECFAKQEKAPRPVISVSERLKAAQPGRHSMPPASAAAPSAGPKFCPECGTANPGAKFCPECGNKLG